MTTATAPGGFAPGRLERSGAAAGPGHALLAGSVPVAEVEHTPAVGAHGRLVDLGRGEVGTVLEARSSAGCAGNALLRREDRSDGGPVPAPGRCDDRRPVTCLLDALGTTPFLNGEGRCCCSTTTPRTLRAPLRHAGWWQKRPAGRSSMTDAPRSARQVTVTRASLAAVAGYSQVCSSGSCCQRQSPRSQVRVRLNRAPRSPGRIRRNSRRRTGCGCHVRSAGTTSSLSGRRHPREHRRQPPVPPAARMRIASSRGRAPTEPFRLHGSPQARLMSIAPAGAAGQIRCRTGAPSPGARRWRSRASAGSAQHPRCSHPHARSARTRQAVHRRLAGPGHVASGPATSSGMQSRVRDGSCCVLVDEGGQRVDVGFGVFHVWKMSHSRQRADLGFVRKAGAFSIITCLAPGGNWVHMPGAFASTNCSAAPA